MEATSAIDVLEDEITSLKDMNNVAYTEEKTVDEHSLRIEALERQLYSRQRQLKLKAATIDDLESEMLTLRAEMAVMKENDEIAVLEGTVVKVGSHENMFENEDSLDGSILSPRRLERTLTPITNSRHVSASRRAFNENNTLGVISPRMIQAMNKVPVEERKNFELFLSSSNDLLGSIAQLLVLCDKQIATVRYIPPHN